MTLSATSRVTVETGSSLLLPLDVELVNDEARLGNGTPSPALLGGDAAAPFAATSVKPGGTCHVAF
jgi:hypothetical protein